VVAVTLVALLVGGRAATLAAQPAPAFPNPAITLDGRGVTINGTDSVTRLNLRFRVQELMSVVSGRDDEGDLAVTQASVLVRRARLRLEGTLKDPRLRVNVQLSFARLDMDQENTGFANVLRDAYVTWQATPSLALAAGQAKLPGNRQRQVSSSELQLPDRSLLNARFTVDRDVGLFASWMHDFGHRRLVVRGALTNGEGRNPQPADAGLAWTGRVEFLPFGAFANGGDYVEGSAGVLQPDHRLSVAAAVSHNSRATRTGGQLGARLFAPRSMTTQFVDAVYKHNGLTVAAEYARRRSANPVTLSGADRRFVYVGDGVHLQASQLFPQWRLEPVVRVTRISASPSIRRYSGGESVDELGMGIARYVHGHRIKYQAEVQRTRFRGEATVRHETALRFGLEVGI
jgi:hypothetical protein